VQIYYENGRSLKNTFRKIRDYFGVSNRPHENTIRNLIQKFESTGSIDNVKPPERKRTVRTVENIAAVRESISNEPSLSIPRSSQQLNISRINLIN